MASKGGVIAVGSIAGLLALFAFTGKAKAAPKGGGVPPISQAECDSAKASRTNMVASIKQIDQQLAAVNSAMQSAADAGDELALYELAQTRQGLLGARANAQSQLKQVDGFLEQCD